LIDDGGQHLTRSIVVSGDHLPCCSCLSSHRASPTPLTAVPNLSGAWQRDDVGARWHCKVGLSRMGAASLAAELICVSEQPAKSAKSRLANPQNRSDVCQTLAKSKHLESPSPSSSTASERTG
jgi:hypothetical protein